MSQKSHQNCSCCGWSNYTTYQGLRTHQGKMGCTPKGLSIPQSQYQYTPFYSSYSKPVSTSTPPSDYSDYESPKPVYQSAKPLIYSTGTKQTCHCGWTKVTSYQGLRIHQGKMGCTPKGLGIPANIQPLFNSSTPRNVATTPKPAEKPASQKKGIYVKNSIERERPPIPPRSVRKSVSHSTPVTSETKPIIEKIKSFYETPQQNRQSATEGYKTRRALDFSTSEQQKAVSKQYQSNSKARIKSAIQAQIRSREQKLAKVWSDAKSCELSSDAEWQEINNVFSEVIYIVKEARDRALRPLENRKEKMKKDAQSVIKKLKNDLDKLEEALDEVDYAADLDDDLFTNLKSKDYLVNTSLPFGTYQTSISTMMEQIQQELDKLSAIELKRIASFTVDVKMDQTTPGHQLLKKIQNGGRSQRDSWAPLRFSSGRSYWEVEVGSGSGWDLGVTSAQTEIRLESKLKPKNGYRAVAHYEGGKYAALTAPPVYLELKDKPLKVGVFLDYEEGLVSFYNVTAETHIHSFTKCRLSYEMCPYFRNSTVTN